MQTLTEIRELLAERGLQPKKALGQNFLTDHNLITKLVDASDVGAGDVVLEVGPGTGTLTEALLERGCRVVACELDRELADLLRDRLGSNDRFTLIEGDCLEDKRHVSARALEALGDGEFSLVDNLPYHAATPLMLSLMGDHPGCRGLWVTIPRVVADRRRAQPGSKAYGSVSVVAALVAEVRVLAKPPPECFWPRPEVTSAMVELRRRDEPGTADARGLAELCQRLFSARRKQLGSVLAGVIGRDVDLPAGVEPRMRAEQLQPEQFESIRRLMV
ncbi:MAG: 16S rRNA (adenine(1518)-N(6)/adenine(1519)-N(6))-dimethyltransferase RsmA [Planctomycetota bacterium]